MKRKIALLVAAVTIGTVVTTGAAAAQSPKGHTPAGWEQTSPSPSPSPVAKQADVKAKPQVGPGGSSVNPGPQRQLWQLILNFLRGLLHIIFPWFHF